MKSEETKRNLASVDPEFALLLTEALELGYANGMNPQVASGYCSPEDQDKAHSIGRTESGKKCTYDRRWQSLSQYGLHVRIAFEEHPENNNRILWNLACRKGLDRKNLLWVGTQVGQFFAPCEWQMGQPDWRELCRQQGIDPITLNRFV